MQEHSPRQRVKVPEAARILGVSVDTVRRRIRSGALKASQKKTSSGHVWMVELPPGYTAADVQASADSANVEALRREISDLRAEIRQLRELLTTTKGSTSLKAVPGSEPVLPWLQRRAGRS
jgi:hypothetical protein